MDADRPKLEAAIRALQKRRNEEQNAKALLDGKNEALDRLTFAQDVSRIAVALQRDVKTNAGI